MAHSSALHVVSFAVLVFIGGCGARTRVLDRTDADVPGSVDGNDIEAGDSDMRGAEIAASGCNNDDDCVVVLHEDRCCSPNPDVMVRDELTRSSCVYELGQSVPNVSPICELGCRECEVMTERVYDAHCVEGQCVPIRDFCPTDEVPVVLFREHAYLLASSPDNWHRLRGTVVRLSGGPFLGPTSCTCCGLPFGPECERCGEDDVQHTLDCQITIRGSFCGVPWHCDGTEDNPSCSPDPNLMDDVLLLDGYLVDSERGGLELWPVSAANECPPGGPNREGGSCDNAEDCAEGLVCVHDCDDMINRCDGVCSMHGNECVDDSDCRVGFCNGGHCQSCSGW